MLLETLGQLGSSRSSVHQAGQLNEPRAFIVPGRKTRMCSMSAEIFVGMEVSQACPDMAVHPGTSFQIPYDEPEIAHAVEQLHTLQPTLIVLEATGGPEVPLAGAPAAVGLLVVVINPRQDRGMPERQGSWPRPIGSTYKSSRTLLKRFGPWFAPRSQ